jgi:1-pyrroline-5-carboxylate dehydrogenase
VFKVSPETSLSGRLLLDVLHDAGLPAGVINFVTGGDATGRALVEHPGVAGITFTGSQAVGLQVLRQSVQGRHPRPCIVEMGGKNATIVSRHADLERAALGIVRSAFGLSGQKCSACSRVYVERPVADALRERLARLAGELSVGDPTAAGALDGAGDRPRRARALRATVPSTWRGSAASTPAANVLTDGVLARGFFVAPTVAQAPLDDRACGATSISCHCCWWVRWIRWPKASRAPTPATTA